jgi:hypothetical protein
VTRTSDARTNETSDRICKAIWFALDVHEVAIVSAIQSQVSPARITPRIPWYVYVAAILLLGWGSLVLAAFLSLKEFGPLFWKAMVPVALELAIGFGLLLRRRWAWFLGITTSAVFIAGGLRRIFFVRGEYVVLDALIHYLVPAIVILVCFLPGRARRAFLGERQAQVV